MNETPRPDEDEIAPHWLRFALVFYTPLGLIAAAWIVFGYGGETLRSRVWGRSGLEDLVLGGVVGLAVVVGGLVLEGVWPEAQRFAAGLAKHVRSLSPLTAFLLALVSGIVEELFFRAALQPELGVLWTTILFGALHVPFERDLLLWPFFAFAVGYLFGALYERNQCALAPMAAHFVINLVNLWRIGKRRTATE